MVKQETTKKQEVEKWEGIHEDFRGVNSEYYQRKWQEKGFDYQQTKQWIDIGFTPSNLDKVMKWKNQGFSLEQVQGWINAGLGTEECEFANDLKQKGHQPFSVDLKVLRKEYYDVQSWLDYWYPLGGTCIEKNSDSFWNVNNNYNFGKERKDIARLEISSKKLEGSLNLEGFAELWMLNCSCNQLVGLNIALAHLGELNCCNNSLTNLDCRELPNLETLDCSDNMLKSLDLSQNTKLRKLDIRNNNFSEQDLSFTSHLVNLENLYLGSNDFIGSLEPLRNLTKLESLDITYTNLDSGLEHLPTNIRHFYYWEDQEKNSIFKIFANEEGKIETGKFYKFYDGFLYFIKEEDFSQKLQTYKKLSVLKQSQNITDSDWTEINQIFTGENDWEEVLKRKLETKGFSKENIQELAQVIFELKFSETVSRWKLGGFTPQQVKEWITVGLSKEEHELASYLQQKNLNLFQVKDDLEKLRDEYNTHLLDEWYPLKERGEVDTVYIQHENLHGTLILQDFPQLKEIIIKCTQLTKLVVFDCPQLEKIYCEDNQLASLEISNCSNLQEIVCDSNKFTNLDFLTSLDPEKLTSLYLQNNSIVQDLTIFSRFKNLENLWINNNSFFGSLEPLINCQKLKKLNIENTTNVSSNLEYLPESLEEIYCTGQLLEVLKSYEDREKEIKVIEISEDEEEYEEDNNCYDLLQDWRKVNHELFAKAKARQLLKNEFQVQEQQIQELRQQLAQFQLKKTTELVTQTDFTSQDWERLQTELNKYQQNLQTRQSSLQELENKKNDLETKLKEKEKETSLLREKASKLQTEISEFQENYRQLVVKLDLEKDDKFLAKELQEAKENIERLEKEMTEAEENLEDNQEQILNLRKELLDKDREIKRVQAEKQIEFDSLQNEKDKLQLEFNSLQTKLESNKKELKNKKQELSETKKNLEKEKLNKSIGLTKELRKQKEKLEKEVENLKEKNEKLEKQLTKKSQQIIIIDDDIKSNAFQVKPNLKNLLGEGGYGKVYCGEWKSQDVAIKKLNLSSSNISDKEITNEIKILKKLRNRYIIQYYGTYSDEQELLIIMDYAENGTLTKFINDNKNKGHDWEFNRELIRQMTCGLAYIHYENIIHRDLKSLNILLTKNYEVRISDFGLSKNITSSQSKNVRGTLGWMAPEVLKEGKFSKHSDIYALGMVIWEIATKCITPFKGTNYNTLALHITNGRKETIPNNVPKNIQEIIRQCWKDNPTERITLEKIIESVGLIQSASEKELPDGDNSKTQGLGANEQNFSSDILGLIIPNDLNTQKEEENSQELMTNIHSNFSEELVSQWENLNFTFHQIQDWINIGLQPTEANFAAWLRDELCLTPEQLLNDQTTNLTDLREQFQTNLETHIEVQPK
ncbi:MAG: protein kinase [Candidatus Moeniiplasma glomeromycotorum]|nr:protein kinase [Candidatus Moeniiplasma glomeromycotorum]MCE8167171.1 protein kinase [Candidatus Moeniiplasma glomeromycotorum]MCE8168817.1 protein kinase [Candidatus Moeniiplasma glomeromycotorum]